MIEPAQRATGRRAGQAVRAGTSSRAEGISVSVAVKEVSGIRLSSGARHFDILASTVSFRRDPNRWGITPKWRNPASRMMFRCSSVKRIGSYWMTIDFHRYTGGTGR